MSNSNVGDGSANRSNVVLDGSGAGSGGDDPYYVGNNELTGNSIVSKVLLGQENYGTWRKSMEIALSGRLKLSFVNGAYPKPVDLVMRAKWQRCNDVIMSWLICSVSEKIVGEILHARDVMTAWKDLEASYAGTNLARKSALLRELSALVQNGMPVSEYNRKLNSLYQEIDAIKTVQCYATTANCLCCKQMVDDKQEDMVVKFLMGLDECYASVRTNVFSMAEVPKMVTVYGMVLTEESTRKATKDRQVEASALFTQNSQSSYSQVSQGRTRDFNRDNSRGGFVKGKGRMFCTHCQIHGHLKENCYKLIGYPQNGKNQKSGANANSGGRFSANAVAVVNDSSNHEMTRNNADNARSNADKSEPQLTSSQLEQIMAMLRSGSTSKSDGQSHMAGIAQSQSFAIDNEHWLIDSGATSHFTYNCDLLHDVHEIQEKCRVTLPNGEQIIIKHKGKCWLKSNILLNNVLLVPQLTVSLISVSQLVKDLKCQVIFTQSQCLVQDHLSRTILETGEPVEGLYQLDLARNKEHEAKACSLEVRHVQNEVELWHNRLGHASMDVLDILLKNKSPKVNCRQFKSCCTVCPMAKQTKLSFPLSNHKTVASFDLVHCDVWGPFHEPTHTGAKYFLTIVDDFSRAVWAFLMQQKSEAAGMIIDFFAMVHTQFGKVVKVLRSDNGGEFFSDVLIKFLQTKGCVHQSSCPHTPQQNGVVERKHRHLLEVARALMLESGLPKVFWGDSVLTATHIINRLPSHVLEGKSPWEKLFHEEPYIENLRVFGCSCYVSTYAHLRDKFDPRALECIFLGYPAGQKGYKVYCLSNEKFYTSRHVVFREDVFPYKRSLPKPSTAQYQGTRLLDPIFPSDLMFDDDDASLFQDRLAADQNTSRLTENVLTEQSDEVTVDVPQTTTCTSIQPDFEPPVNVRKSSRHHAPPVWAKDYVCNTITKMTSPHMIENFISYSKCSKQHQHFVMQMSAIKEPSSYNQAHTDPNWVEAMDKEIKALEANNTWILTELPAGKTLVDCKWVYKLKFKSDGTLERYKARLVARGFTQVEGLDYHDTFAPVAKMTTIRCLLAVAAVKHWPIYQLDVDNAFLHGTLDEEVYMKLPIGFYKKEKAAGKVCKLVKSLYGLKQASRQWFAKFSEAITAYGFQRSLNDYSLFTMNKDGEFLILLVYVDDVIITGTSSSMIGKVKQYIHDLFKIKDLGILKYFLGLEVARSDEGIFLNQRKYALELLEDHNLLQCKPAKTPMPSKHQLSLSAEPLLVDPLPYRKLVGKLIYMTITRPDLAYPIHILSQYMQNPTEEHWRAATRLLRYVKGAPAQGILFSAQSSLDLRTFCDADRATCPITRKSITGHCVLLGSSIISWKTKKQPVVSRSSTESEYRAMAVVCCELVWLARLLGDLGVEVPRPIPLYCDNKAAIHIAHNPVFHERTKHIEIDCHLVRSHILSSFISPLHVSTTEQPADIFTKSLQRDQLQHLCSKLGISNFLHAAT
ncbi:unnamed protein product [Rhodiola kirilowii]